MRLQALIGSALLALAPFAVSAAPATSKPAPAPVVTEEPDAAGIAERVQAFYEKTKTYKASFKQSYKIKKHGKKKDSSGSVVFEKPGKMSFTYTNGNRVVSDGKLIKVYEKDNKQMFESSMAKSQYPAALAFLVGDGDLKKSFKLRKLDAKKLNFESGYVLEGIPVEATPAYQRMLLYVDRKTSQVRRVLLIDAEGNVNRFDFLKPVVNKPVAKGEFEFKPPPGTQIIRP